MYYYFTIRGTAIMADGKRESLVVHDYETQNRSPSDAELRGRLLKNANDVEYGVLGTLREITNISFVLTKEGRGW